ncbi:MAG TPA: hypothetical protein VLR88_09700 [Propionibacteriaceae bacterium]|nr:hypothetical protein [Propionibacteriaceae bacterium]
MAFQQYAEPRGRSASHAGGALRSVSGRERDLSSRIYVPPGWPEGVLPPGAPDWELTATAYLLDCCPADYRGYPVLSRHPVVLARFAAEFVESQIRASRESLTRARADLSDYVGGDVLDSAVDVMQAEGARLVRVRRAVMLIEESLRGRIFLKRL